ncbi:hypothetical protein GCM10025881_29200 [Pseudolysinimonas kribbensis]|uniref:HTH asnC-type domain-containing protein n=1 Tax=Pseudolysinimonas kribbensis TaxID=433641 RepID=A0ABQ6KC57_9MICO|nr:hypothetical protein GCM10025881_29200 [Pseudolysinimonas kribbensis]
MAALTELDRRLLAALREDGRMPLAELARRLGVARATVTARIDRLTADGVIVGFTVQVRDETELDAIRAMSLIEVEGRTTDAVIRRLRAFPRSPRCTRPTAGGTSSPSCGSRISRSSTGCWAGSGRSRASSTARRACC